MKKNIGLAALAAATAAAQLRLYAVVLGGRLAGTRLGEDHETVFVAAESETQARAKGKAKWSGSTRKGLHVDAVACVEQVDGFAVRLEPVG